MVNNRKILNEILTFETFNIEKWTANAYFFFIKKNEDIGVLCNIGQGA